MRVERGPQGSRPVRDTGEEEEFPQGSGLDPFVIGKGESGVGSGGTLTEGRTKKGKEAPPRPVPPPSHPSSPPQWVDGGS